MSYEITQQIKITNPASNVDWYYNGGNANGWASVSTACSGVPAEVRQVGKTVAISDGNGGVVEYWWKSGTTDADLVEKTNGSSSSLTLDDVPDGETRKLANYLPLSGGTLTSPEGTYTPLVLKSSNTTQSRIRFLGSDDATMGYIGVKKINNVYRPYFYDSTTKQIALVSDIPSIPSALPANGGTSDIAKALDTDSTVITAAGGNYDTAVINALKNYFNNNASSIPRNKLLHYTVNVTSNTSAVKNTIVGWWDEGSTPIGGFLMYNYGSLNYYAINGSTYTRQIVLTNKNISGYAITPFGGSDNILNADISDKVLTFFGDSSYKRISLVFNPTGWDTDYYLTFKNAASSGTADYQLFWRNKQLAVLDDINQTSVLTALGGNSSATSPTRFLREDGAWIVPSGGGGGGTVDVSISNANNANVNETGRALSSANINSSGVITFTKQNIISSVDVGYSSNNITKNINGTTSNVVSASTIVTDGGGLKESNVSVSGATLAWNTATTIATIGSVDITAKLPSNPNTDTKNTTGTTNSNNTLYLIGAMEQSANPVTYSNSNAILNHNEGTRTLMLNRTLPNVSQQYEQYSLYCDLTVTGSNTPTIDKRSAAIYAKDSVKVNNTYAGYFDGSVYCTDSLVSKTLNVTNSLVASSVTATNVYQTSDDRLKNYKGDFTFDINKLNDIPLRYYEYKDNVKGLDGTIFSNNDGKTYIGTSAQELQKVLPEVVGKNCNTGFLNVDYSKLTLVALDCIKQQQKQINELKNEIESLKRK